MTAIRIKNLDEVYSTIKSLSGTLNVCGWDNPVLSGVSWYKTDTLIHWMFENIQAIKAGCDDITVCFAEYNDDHGYGAYQDAIHMTSTPTSSGLLVELTSIRHREAGHHDYRGDYAVESYQEQVVFLLKVR